MTDVQAVAGSQSRTGLSTSPPADTIMPIPTSGPSPNTATDTPEAVRPPGVSHIEEKRYMLELINAERIEVGLHPVALGDNVAAQVHAEASLKYCFSSHWGIDGLKPYMRYSLAGGYWVISATPVRGRPNQSLSACPELGRSVTRPDLYDRPI